LQFINNLEQVPQVAKYLTPLCIDPIYKSERGTHCIPENFIELQDFLKEKSIPKITKVPSVVLSSDEIIILSGSDAFNWLDKITSQNQDDQRDQKNAQSNSQSQSQSQLQLQLEGVNPNEMMSFSDSYSMLNSDSVSNQSYQFINKELQSIPTLEEQSIDNKEQFCQRKYEELLKERERM
jgi:hypothetical protein